MKVALVAPDNATPSFRHWYVSGAVPVAVTLKLAAWPAVTVLATGWTVIAGATGAAVTVRVAPLLVAEPAPLVTTTL